ncbi:hypothetical protein ADL12_11860 [Streptomyces regalis]|uniref:Uncharacterized protein n=1 Tax=Streptomyces regalis TaxID=68262 RepID=A0A0X3V830_9ACTN|nr:hypothetical protein ADL12_11860 [Streptomyces regalis]
MRGVPAGGLLVDEFVGVGAVDDQHTSGDQPAQRGRHEQRRELHLDRRESGTVLLLAEEYAADRTEGSSA